MTKQVLEEFPFTRLRRNRQTEWQRDLVAETVLLPKDLILPIFVQETSEQVVEIHSMPGSARHTIKSAIKLVKEARDAGVLAINIFPAIDKSLKCPEGKVGLSDNTLIARTIAAIKDAVPEIGIISDVALDPYTSHGHDGVLDSKGRVDNDRTIEKLCEQALIFAKAGASIISPSDAMDGRIGVIRNYLDENNMHDISLMSYAVKFSSSFYSPFRDAVGSKTNGVEADKRTYHMDYRNSSEAIRETGMDIKEGADMVIVKPGLPYLDIIRSIKDNFNIPILAYQVSGEYSMFKAAAGNGWLNEENVFKESFYAFKRAGACAILTYYAIEMARKLH
jgi:porphobilinogen synthase